MPLLFQRSSAGQNRPVSAPTIRKAHGETLAASGLTDSVGDPLAYPPHDFRRIFVTDAILSGLPPHVAQVICGHKSITTTMGYKDLRELHQTGEDLQVASSGRRADGLQRYYELAV
ncbi:tyrosine-type recombinase/integrase [Streptomyces sp. NPDC127072]|uniref:site-specific integrase n=1 Tax=Streptomyces sp. NPDC127072 TaxID=3347129 RepID=UPI0036529E93